MQRISEERTRKEMIDSLLEKAGWYLRDHSKKQVNGLFESLRQKNRFGKIPLVIFGCIVVILCCVVLYSLLSPFLAFFGLILVSAMSHPVAAPKIFPDREIIYIGGEGLGFIDADGLNPETFRFRALEHSVLDEGMEIYIMPGDHNALVTIDTGYSTFQGSVLIAHPGELAVNCGWDGTVLLAPDQKHILIGTEQGYEEYLLTDCGTANSPGRYIHGVSGILSPDERYSVDTQYSWSEEDGNKFDLIIHDLGSGEERVIENGRFPVWSRNSQRLAYTGVDGIYVIQNNPSAESQRVITIEMSNLYIPLYDYGRYPPVASWSPDGEWLVYHVYHEPLTDEDGNEYYYSIFKVNVETGIANKLLDNGMFPYWIWPVNGN